MEYVLLDFYATWCEPCKWSEPIVEALMKEFSGTVRLRKIDIDQEADVASSYGIRSVPTFLLLKDQQEVWRMNGFDTAPRMAATIRDVIKRQEA
jgi:thioredoxin 1